jgi:hypothetical protein
MSLLYGLLASLIGCTLCYSLVSRAAQRRGIHAASSTSVLQSMLIGLGLGELIWFPFSIQLAPPNSTHPLQFVFGEQALMTLSLTGIMGCFSVIGTLYWGCTAVILGLLSFKRWGIQLADATRVYLPWTSLWTLAHLGFFFILCRQLAGSS